MATSKQKGNKERPLTIKEKAFCREYAKTGNGTQSIIKAGYKVKDENSASVISSRLLGKVMVKEEIGRLMEKKEEKAIMTSQEVMQMFTDIAQGKIKDQFGLDASLNDRLKALQELAKRTIDIDKKIEMNKQGIADNTVNIKIDWSRD